ncbi:MAG: hypothetical protein ACKOFV_03040, partial [Candidatus Nanopelagicaceae bacterium]
MAITFPKPNLIKPKVPAVVALGLLVAQYLLLGTGKPTEPYCKLKIERPHHSTYLKERDNI